MTAPMWFPPPNRIANPNFAGTTSPRPGWERSKNMNGTASAGVITIMGDSVETTAALWGPSGTGVVEARGTTGQTVKLKARVKRANDYATGDGSKWTISLRAGWTGTIAAVGKGYSNPAGTLITDAAGWQDIELTAVLTSADAAQPIWVLFESEHTDPLNSAPLLVEYGSLYMGIADAADFDAPSGEPTADEPPAAPTNVAVGNPTVSTLTVSWSAATDDIGVVGYNVYEGSTKVNPVLVTALSYTVTGLQPESEHTYTVKAVDTTGQESAASAAATGTTTAVPAVNEPPTPPTGLAVVDATPTTITLMWEPGTDDVGVAGYNVYRGTTKLTDTPVLALTHVAGGLTPLTTFTFTVRTVDAGGLESVAATVSGSTTEAPPVATDDPWLDHTDLANALAPRVAAHVGLPDDAETTAAAASFIPSVAEYVRGYTRGRGWRGTEPAGPLKVVIVAAAARLVANPEQVSYYTTGDYSERPAVLNGWTLPELSILRRYRRTAA